jgi:hypothetical protein
MKKNTHATAAGKIGNVQAEILESMRERVAAVTLPAVGDECRAAGIDPPAARGELRASQTRRSVKKTVVAVTRKR